MRFKPKLRDIIQDYNMDTIAVIPKNRGYEGILAKILYNLGVDPDKLEKGRDEFTDRGIEFRIYRGEDIPRLLEDMYRNNSTKAVGLTGDDIFDENGLRSPGTPLEIFETIDWYDDKARFGRPALCVISKGKGLEGEVRIAINAKYEMTSRMYVEEIAENGNIKPVFSVYSGNTELTVVQDINDVAIEVVYSGRTVTNNRLRIIGDPIRYSDLVVIGVNERSPRVFSIDYGQVLGRVQNPVKGSYTAELAGDENKATKKIGEEAAEFISAILKGESIPDEFLDLWYAMSVNAAMKGVGFDKIIQKLWRRVKP